MREAMTDRVADWRLLGLGFWQAWQTAAMCTDIVAPTSGKLFDQGNALLILLVLMTAAYLAVVVASRRYAPFAGRGSSYVLAAALMAAGTLAMPVALHFLEGIVGIGVFVMAAASASLGNALLLIMWGELWSALATGRVGRHLYASYTFAFVLFFLIYFMPQASVAVMATTLLPIISTAVLYACRHEPRREPSVVPLDVHTIPVARLLVCLFIISVIWGLTQGIVGTFAEGDEFHMAKSLLLAGGGIGAITLSMAVTSSPSEALTLYKPVIPAMVAGIVLLLLQPAVYPFLGRGSLSWASTASICFSCSSLRTSPSGGASPWPSPSAWRFWRPAPARSSVRWLRTDFCSRRSGRPSCAPISVWSRCCCLPSSACCSLPWPMCNGST